MKSTTTPRKSKNIRSTLVVPGSLCAENQGSCPFYVPDMGQGSDQCLRLRLGSLSCRDGWPLRSASCPFGGSDLRITVLADSEEV